MCMWFNWGNQIFLGILNWWTMSRWSVWALVQFFSFLVLKAPIQSMVVDIFFRFRENLWESVLKEINPLGVDICSLRGLMLKLKFQATWCEDLRLVEKDPDPGKEWWQLEKGRQRVRWLESITDLMGGIWATLGDSERQRRLACYNPHGHKELDMTYQLNNNYENPIIFSANSSAFIPFFSFFPSSSLTLPLKYSCVCLCLEQLEVHPLTTAKLGLRRVQLIRFVLSKMVFNKHLLLNPNTQNKWTPLWRRRICVSPQVLLQVLSCSLLSFLLLPQTALRLTHLSPEDV